jgi:mono/diheme cytochrome c family protein
MKMKKILKITVGFFAVLVILILCGGLYLKYFLPNIKVKELKIVTTKERIERGKYLANNVLVCVDCHSERDWTKYSGPIVSGTEGMGGEFFDQTMGLPGKYISANITPYSLSNWSDGEIYRAISSGVGKRNNTIFPVMPFMAYGTLDNEDIYSVITYLRSIPSIKNDLPASVSDFPVNFLINTMAKEGHPSKRPPLQDSINYGKYITTAAGCVECHTPVTDKGDLILAKAYSGGRNFPVKGGGTSVSMNITFDKKTGIGEWDKNMFIIMFKKYDLTTYVPPTVGKGDLNTPMPWTMYAKMDTTDLIAIYNYLKSLPPIENNVIKSKPLSN